jgi:hypothetical protein
MSIEKIFFRNKKNRHFVFSFTDQKIIKKLYKSCASILPVFINKQPLFNRKIIPGLWLLIGNWGRKENMRGAEIFLKEYASLISDKVKNVAIFHFVGHGADIFIQKLLSINKDLARLHIKATPYYKNLNDFNGATLLAPILEGAGVKIKTLEAWSFGFPVIGTSQAFSGLPKNIWEKGGIMSNSIKDMAHLCIECETSSYRLKILKPNEAFDKYKNAIK